MDDHSHACTNHQTHEHCSLTSEIMCHLPYAIFSAALGLIVISFLNFFGCFEAAVEHAHEHAGHSHGSGVFQLFHSFHFLHIVFAATGALITFSVFHRILLKVLLSPLFLHFFSVPCQISFCHM